MSDALLSPPILVADEQGLAALVVELAKYPAVAVDTESNSMHAYREQVCLVQFSAPGADFIVDPIRVPDISSLATVFANPAQQKIFHAAEYDIICMRRDYGFEFANIYDTMSAARTLGWPQVGLASILDTHFGVKMNKKYQRADWKRRPLSPEQLDYARLDTHYLVALRDKQIEDLKESGRLQEAEEEFARLAKLGIDVDSSAPNPPSASPTAFWRVKGARDLGPGQAAVLQKVFAYREQQAERSDRPPFMVMGEPILTELARRAPRDAEALKAVPGVTPDLIRRHGTTLLQAIKEGLAASPQHPPQAERESDDVQDRYDRLHTWRKERAKKRGVESDVILPRTALWDMARRPPRTRDDLAHIADFGPWRRETYGEELLALLAKEPQRPSRN